MENPASTSASWALAVSRMTRVVLRSGARAQLLEHLQAAHPRHHHVQHGDVGTVLDRPGQSLVAVLGHQHLETRGLQLEGHEVTDVAVVVGNEHGGHERGS